MQKDTLKSFLSLVYSDCIDFEEMDIKRKEMIRLVEKTYQLEKSFRDDMEDFKNEDFR